MGQLAAGYRDGRDVPKDLDLATQWFERAADFTVEAMYQSYLMYSQDAVTKKPHDQTSWELQKLVVKVSFPKITESLQPTWVKMCTHPQN